MVARTLVFAFFLASSAAWAQVNEVDFDPQIGADVPGSLEFREATAAVLLGQYFGARPIVLVLGYFGCRHLCPLLVDGVSEALARSGMKPERDYSALFVSIDPRDEAAAPNRRAGWHLLSGAASAARLARIVGFKFFYDKETGEFGHPAGFLVLTPQGQLARYFPGVRFDAQLVKAAIADAARGETSNAFERFLLRCFHDPVTGKYSQAVLISVRVAGLLFLALLGFFGWRWLKPSRTN